MATDLTKEALEGYAAGERAETTCPYFLSSDAWLAWTFGNLAARHRAGAPDSVEKSRGFSLRVDGVQIWRCHFRRGYPGSTEFVRQPWAPPQPPPEPGKET